MSEAWTIKGMLDWCEEYLEAKGDESPRVVAQLLVSHVTGLSRVELFMNYGRELSAAELDTLRPMIKRRGQGEPLQYILGTAPFRYLDIIVRPGVLIPRPETEVLVSEVLAALPAAARRVAADSLMNEYDGAALLEERRAAGAAKDAELAAVGASGGTGANGAEAAGTLGASGAFAAGSAGRVASNGASHVVADDGFDLDSDLVEDEPVEMPGDAVVFGGGAPIGDEGGTSLEDGDAGLSNVALAQGASLGASLGASTSMVTGPRGRVDAANCGAAVGSNAATSNKGESASEVGGSLPDGILVADICTGSGCIACSLATERDDVRVVATDLSPVAVSLARENAKACGAASRIGVLEGDLGLPIETIRPQFMGAFDAIVSNPPYVPTSVVAELPNEVAGFEPELALDGGEDGLDLYRRLLPWSHRALKPGGVFACELHETCLDMAADLARQEGMIEVRVVRDLTNRPRVLVCRKAR